jgi:3-hydroxybutyryl-CoA dehydrogenase
MKPDEVRRVGVAGCGIMGSGIVEVCAKAGLDVTVVEADEEAMARGRRAIERSTARAVERGKLDEGERRRALERITDSTNLEDLADVDLFIEAVAEDLGLKEDVFRTVDRVTRPEVVLATNTSSLPITDVAAATTRPDRVVGMHFFNPPPVMRLIELIPGVTTSEETLEFARGMGARLGKVTVLAKDRAGFIVNFLLVPYLNSAVRLYDEEFATAEDIDNAIALGLGHPMGPLALLDLIGLDTALHVANVLYEEFKHPDYAPPPLLRRMVTAGRLGRKSGSGFYEYS